MKLKLQILPNIFIENKHFTFAKVYMLKGKNVSLKLQTTVIRISKTKSVRLTCWLYQKMIKVERVDKIPELRLSVKTLSYPDNKT
jgi:hypothetical protein